MIDAIIPALLFFAHPIAAQDARASVAIDAELNRAESVRSIIPASEITEQNFIESVRDLLREAGVDPLDVAFYFFPGPVSHEGNHLHGNFASTVPILDAYGVWHGHVALGVNTFWIDGAMRALRPPDFYLYVWEHEIGHIKNMVDFIERQGLIVDLIGAESGAVRELLRYNDEFTAIAYGTARVDPQSKILKNYLADEKAGAVFRYESGLRSLTDASRARFVELVDLPTVTLRRMIEQRQHLGASA